MKKTAFYFLTGAIIICIGIFITCRVVKEDSNGIVNVADFCLSESDLGGWNLWGNDCQAHSSDVLLNDPSDDGTGSKNGGATVYQSNNLLEYVYQEMTRDGGKEITAYVMDMQNNENALAIFEIKKEEKVTNKLVLTNYNENTAVMNEPTMGSRYYLLAHFERFYFELTLLNMDDPDNAITTAELFLLLYKSKLQNSGN